MRFSPARFCSLAAIGLLLAACGAPKSKPEEVANTFFADIKKGDISSAYAATSFSFQAQQTLAAFDSKLRDLRLGQFQSLTWEPAVPSGSDDVKLRGTLTRTANDQFFIRISLHRASGRWQISTLAADTRDQDGQPVAFSLLGENPAFLSATATRIPPQDEVQQMVRATLVAFNAALERNDFDGIYAMISTLWQQQISRERFGNSFQSFVQRGIQLRGIDQRPIIFDEPPRIQGKGVLLVPGHAEINPAPVAFQLKYIYEAPKWRLIGVSLNLDDAKLKQTNASPAATPKR